jgi:DNA segregation ATPase FtsK/SpoIIIE, S-DNA-T family
MKVCPACNQSYKDDINFCLSDGSTLLKKGAEKPKKHSYLNDVLALGVLAIAILLFLSLVSHAWSDPSFNSTGFGGNSKTHNWIGPVGAYFSDLLIQAIGISAYVFPALVALAAWRIYQSESVRPSVRRIVGFVLFIASLATLTKLVGIDGGIIPEFLARYSSAFLGWIGATILFATALIASVILLTNTTFRGFWASVDLAKTNVLVRFNEWKQKRQGHADEVAAAKERSEKRRKKREEVVAEPPDTIAVGEAEAVATMAAAAGVGTQAELPLEAIPAEPEISAPTISAAERVAVEEDIPSRSEEEIETVSDAEGDASPETISISPVKHTGDLEEEALDAAEEEFTPEPEPPRPSYENYILPHSTFLTAPDPPIEQKEAELRALATELQEKTKEFNVTGRVMHISQGPVVTTFEFKPDPGVKYSRVTNLVDDLCLALKAESIRIDRIPGKAFVGIEVPNKVRETIRLREVIDSRKFKDSSSLLTVALGKTIDGLNYVTDLAKMPHLLIAGATGAGKSVGVNTLVMSILFKARPDEVKFIMVDPKRLELGLYADIPHLLHPIIVEPKKAATALKNMVFEMERRYKELAGWGVRNIDGYNTEVERRNSVEQFDDNGEPWRRLPYIVVIIDELADLMMVSGKEVEDAITRLAQMARAVGIHLVLATQRPSVDVITGLIKANFPSRISFRVSSKVDSRTIIDANGSEGLLGKGDMLFLPPGSSQVVRIHGAFVDEREIGRVVDHIKSYGKPEYDTTITKTEEELDDSGDLPGRRDPLFLDALRTVVSAKRASTSLLQRHLRIGYGRAAAILDAMVREGYIGEMDGSTRARAILAKAYEDLQDYEEMGSA